MHVKIFTPTCTHTQLITALMNEKEVRVKGRKEDVMRNREVKRRGKSEKREERDKERWEMR